MRTGTANDPLWYKDAIIYEVPVKSSSDRSADGGGDFPGLCEKLDYLQGPGATCLSPRNGKVLACVRRYRNDVILCVASLSRTVQPTELDLRAFAGLMPVEMLGFAEFHTIETAPLFSDAWAVWLLPV